MDETTDKDILKIKEIIGKIKISNNEKLDDLAPEKRPSKVMIAFNDDSFENLEKITYYPLGEMENPLSEEDILEKFKLLNPKFNMNKLQIIKHMEDYPIDEVFEELGLMDS